jgi:hypothetical protein
MPEGIPIVDDAVCHGLGQALCVGAKRWLHLRQRSLKVTLGHLQGARQGQAGTGQAAGRCLIQYCIMQGQHQSCAMAIEPTTSSSCMQHNNSSHHYCATTTP